MCDLRKKLSREYPHLYESLKKKEEKIYQVFIKCHITWPFSVFYFSSCSRLTWIFLFSFSLLLLSFFFSASAHTIFFLFFFILFWIWTFLSTLCIVSIRWTSISSITRWKGSKCLMPSTHSLSINRVRVLKCIYDASHITTCRCRFFFHNFLFVFQLTFDFSSLLIYRQ